MEDKGMEGWRLIIDPALEGAENMASDEAVLRACEAEPSAPPVLRLYGWSEPTLSIGYLQNASPFLSTSMPVVRRITGGRAVLHDKELTYSLVAGTGHHLFSGGILAAYSFISGCIISALKQAGVDAEFARGAGASGGKDACFYTPSRYEVLVDGRKLVGSSQRRFKKAFLQHGSILLCVDREKNAKVFGPEVVGRMASLSEFSDISHEEFRRAFISAMATGLKAAFTPSELNERETLVKEELKRRRYSDAGWTLCGPRDRSDLTGAPGHRLG